MNKIVERKKQQEMNLWIAGDSGIVVKDIEVELLFLIWKVYNHSVSAFYAYMHSGGLQDGKVISIWVQLNFILWKFHTWPYCRNRTRMGTWLDPTLK